MHVLQIIVSVRLYMDEICVYTYINKNVYIYSHAFLFWYTLAKM